MTGSTLEPVEPGATIPIQPGLSGLHSELEQILSDRFASQKIAIFGQENQALIASLQQNGLHIQSSENARTIGEKLDLLVVLSSQTNPDDLSPILVENAGSVLLVQESSLQPGFSTSGVEAWLNWLAQHGFHPDLNYRPVIAGRQAIYLQRYESSSEAGLAAQYEQLIWSLESETAARRALLLEMRDELSVNGFDAAQIPVRLKVAELRQENEVLKQAYQEIYNSRSWKLMRRVQNVRQRIIPPGSQREHRIRSLYRGLVVMSKEGPLPGLKRSSRRISWRLRSRLQSKRFQSPEYIQSQSFEVPPIQDRPTPGPHTAQIDIIICVHNALEDVKRCLQSVVTHSTLPYHLILVDDGSQPETRDYLAAFSLQYASLLLRNETARGYTFAANQGLQAAQGDFSVLLNSDTIVTPGWLDQMTACALSDDKIGVVGPLSNTASWQSIPNLSEDGDWATNPLPHGMTVATMGTLVASRSARLYPEMKLLNGFCLFIRRAVLEQIGHFDEEKFGAGYGEEDDFCLRARAAGWKLALADDTYIYHAQSKSYSSERRKQLYEKAGQNLREKHGERIIQAGVEFNQFNPVIQGIRARSQIWNSRQELITAGERTYRGKRVLFLLPIMFAGGGGNVIISEALAMRRMGVEVQFLNLPEFSQAFRQSYPDLNIPVIYAALQDLIQIGSRFDAVVATINTSVAWLQDLQTAQPQIKLGYYVQGFEPLMYSEGSPEYQNALHSYTLFPGLIPFTKTAWTRQQVQDHTGAICQIVGPSVEIDLFQPRPSIWRVEGDQTVKIAAMVRADSAYRAPRLTMEVLQKASWRYSPAVEILLFGIDPEHPEFSKLPVEFAWRATGLLSPRQVARLMSEIDIFVDFSQHQAMGLSALEAMACGAAVIVPQNGGAVEFVRDGQNGLVVDTTSMNACWQALQRLIDDAALRRKIQDQALQDVCQYYPEQAASRILKALFNE
ncbi:MAG TPA: glycosyltransferase [Anaerolineales bacterium]|nr:glycosyltransferase [Anaerolineales bacterium]